MIKDQILDRPKPFCPDKNGFHFGKKSFLDRVASGPGISGNLEKSGNFVALGKVREFREIQKSQGILIV